MAFFRTDDLAGVEMLPGVTRRAVWLEGVMMTFFEFEPNTVIPSHDHPHEQITYVVKGRLAFTLGQETREIGPGEGVCVSSGIPHSARVLGQPAVVLDAWHPVRDDYR